jgi:hypothetical protein
VNMGLWVGSLWGSRSPVGEIPEAVFAILWAVGLLGSAIWAHHPLLHAILRAPRGEPAVAACGRSAPGHHHRCRASVPKTPQGTFASAEVTLMGRELGVHGGQRPRGATLGGTF